MIFNQSEAVATYDAVGTTVVASRPFFAVATWLNPPENVEVFDDAGAQRFSFSSGAGSYLVDTARHAESKSLAVDVFVAYVTASGSTLYGLVSTGAGTPSWSLPLPGCATDGGGGTYTGIEASDDGSALAFLCHDSTQSPSTARVYGVDGQTGAVSFFYDLGPSVQAGQGQVQITGDGSFVLFVNEQGKPTPNTAAAFVLDKTGALRDMVIIPFFITAAISDSGDYIVVGDDPAVHVWKWDAPSAKYVAAYDLNPPGGSWIPWDVQMSTGSDDSEMVVVGYIAGDVLSVQVTMWSLVGAAQLSTWVSPVNSHLQENPTLRCDASYCGVSLWGDVGEAGYPTVVLLKANSNVPLFNYTSPGSMMAVDVNVVAGPASDTVYLAAGGKAVPANTFGNGGNAYGWKIMV